MNMDSFESKEGPHLLTASLKTPLRFIGSLLLLHLTFLSVYINLKNLSAQKINK